MIIECIVDILMLIPIFRFLRCQNPYVCLRNPFSKYKHLHGHMGMSSLSMNGMDGFGESMMGMGGFGMSLMGMGGMDRKKPDRLGFLPCTFEEDINGNGFKQVNKFDSCLVSFRILEGVDD